MIKFTNIRWKNFLSTGNKWIEVQLDKSPTTLIVGKNGSGKTTLLDALTFGLFGSPFRNINKPNLINSVNGRDCVVEVEFTIGKKEYKIIRGIKPSIFEIYAAGRLVKQDAKANDYQDHLEKFIIKMTYKSFTQIVVLGSSSFTPFMRLKAADRRDIIEDLLDIQIFSFMNVILKQKIVDVRDGLSQTEHDLDLIKVKVESLEKYIKEIKTSNQDRVDKHLEELEENKKHKATAMEKAVEIQKLIDDLLTKITDQDKVHSKSKKFNALSAQISSNATKFSKEVAFYNNNDNCPTCHQEIEPTFKQDRIAERNKKIEEMKKGLQELDKQMRLLDGRLKEIESVEIEVDLYKSELIRFNASISAINKYINKVQQEIEHLETDSDNFTNEQKKLDDLIAEKKRLKITKADLITDGQYYEVAAGLLKDSGIKTKIIRQYLPKINKLVNSYLSAMDFFVNFNLDENFQETIKSRFRDEFQYGNFSEGEKQKIDLSLLFTWRAIAKLKNSVSTNVLILDEVFDSSLDSNATEDLLKILSTLGADTNLFVISHREDILIDKFRTVIKFVKSGNFSQMSM